MTTKQCYRCKQIKSISKFYQCKTGINSGDIGSYCKKCQINYPTKNKKDNQRRWKQSVGGRLSQKKYNLIHRSKTKDLSIQTIQVVYEDNIKKYGTLTCYLCLNPIEFKQDSLEHKTPLSRGGTNEYNNLAVACKKCNE